MGRIVAAFALLCAVVTPGIGADCSDGAVATARAAFKARYDARDFAAAREILNEVWSGCFIEKPDGIVAAEIASDLAIAAHRAGDSDECLQTLSDFMPGYRSAERRLAALPERLRKAIVFNIALCEKQCPGPGPGCLTARVARAHAKLHRGDFAATRPCAFDAGEGAYAVTADLCLKVEAPKREVDLGEREQAKPSDICPGLSLVSRAGRKRAVAIANASWLRQVETCCAEIAVESAAGGHVRIAPAENPPEGCMSGKRTYVAEEIFRLDGSALKPAGRAMIGVR